MVLAVEFDMRLVPQSLHHAHLFGRARPAVVEILVEADKLDLVPADADAEAEAAAAQYIERGRLFGDERRLALRQYQHADGEADLCRAAGQEAEQHERVVIGVGRRADTVAAMRAVGIGAEHMVGRDEIIIADPLGGLRVIANAGGACADVNHRE
jgi:hypothetical protein